VVGKTVDAIEAVEKIGDQFVDMDRPFVAANSLKVRGGESYTSWPNCENVDQGIFLDLFGASMNVPSSKALVVRQNEMDLQWLLQKKSFVGAFELSSTMSVNDIICVLDYCPGFEFFNKPLGATFTPTLLTYLSMWFSYWSGDMIYSFSVIANAGHSAKIAHCTHYGYEASGLSVDEAFGQDVTMFEIKGTMSFDIKIPWRSITPMKKVNNGSNTNTKLFSNGQGSLRVLSPLQYNSLIADSVQILVYVSAAPGFKLNFLGNNGVDCVPQRLTT